MAVYGAGLFGNGPSFDITREQAIVKEARAVKDASLDGDQVAAEASVGEPVRFYHDLDSILGDDESVWIIPNETAGDGARVVGIQANPGDEHEVERVAGILWNDFADEMSEDADGDAVHTEKATLLRGKFTAKLDETTWFNTDTVTPAVGHDVIILAEESGKPQYACLSNDPEKRYLGTAAGYTGAALELLEDDVAPKVSSVRTELALAVERQVIGKVINIDSDGFVEVEFDFS